MVTSTLVEMESVLGPKGKKVFMTTGISLAIIVTALLAYQYYRIEELINQAEDEVQKNRYKHLSVQAAAVLGIHVITMLMVPVDALNYNGHNVWVAWAIQSSGAVATILNAILAAQIQSVGSDNELRSVSLSSVAMQVVANMLMLALIFRVRINKEE